MLISVSFLHIIPKAFEMNPNAPMFLLIGLFEVWVPRRIVERYLGEGAGVAAVPWVMLLGMIQMGPSQLLGLPWRPEPGEYMRSSAERERTP